jgi:multiple sugar transport system substrate-binding protein
MSDSDFDLDFGDDFLNEVYEHRMSRRRLLQAGGALGLATAAGPLIFTQDSDAAALFSDPLKSNLPYHANTSVKGHVVFWHHWASPLRHSAIRMAIKQFTQVYKGVKVTDVAFPFGSNWDKVRAGVAANSSSVPDVIISDRPSLWNDAKHKVYDSLQPLVKRDRLTSKPFWGFTWNEAMVSKQLYGLPYETDCRVLFWNRAKFQDAGLNTNKGPTTWGQLPGFAAKLDKKGSGPGGWDTVTFNPRWGGSISTWAWTNKSSLLNSKGQPVINSARNIQTADWMKGWVERYGGMGTFQAIQSRNSDSAHNEFGNGFTAFDIFIPGQQAVMNYYGIQFVNAKGDKPFPFWGVGLVPHNTGGKSYNFSGGFSLSIPRNHKRSKATTDATWEFMKFMTFVGQRTWARTTNAIPTVVDIAKKDPILNSTIHWKVFLQAMALGHAKERSFKDALFPDDVMGKAEDDIMNGRKSAKEALDTAQSQELVNMSKPGAL